MEHERLDRLLREHPLYDEPHKEHRPRETLVEVINSGLVPPGKVLDLCAGNGTNALYSAQQRLEVTATDVRGVDLSEARSRASEAKVSIDFRPSRSPYLPFPADEFGFAYAMECFYNVGGDREQLVREVHRVLRPGGRFFVLIPSYQEGVGKGATRQQIEELFHPYFEVERIVETDALDDERADFFYAVLMHRD